MPAKTWAALSSELTEATATVGEAVVAVQGRRHPSSGILWGRDAVVTVSHSLPGDETLKVVLAPGRTSSARLAGRDPRTDTAVLKLAESVEPAVRWSESSGLKVGELMLALGRTWRGNIVASSGVLSGLTGPCRTWRGGELDQFIRPDLVIYPGFSGGP